LNPELADLAHRQDVRAHGPRILVPVARSRGYVADAKLRQAADIALLGGAAHRIAVAVAHPVANVDEIEMRVELDDVDRTILRTILIEGVDAGNVDRVIAAKNDRQGSGRENFAYTEFDVRVARVGIGMNDVGVTEIDDPDLVGRQVGDVVL